jgi:hypothetical protein
MFKKFTQSELEEEGLDIDSARRIFCGRCDALITDAGKITSIDGRHTHRRTNPDNIEFSFQCFTAAPGCRHRGAYTFEHTWFPGSAWCYLLCGQCATHLGWHFQGEYNFCALIIERLRYEG